MSRNTAAIGIIDSGVGGLAIAKAIHQHLPNEKLIYLADNYYAPYGEKTAYFIQQRINFIVQKFIDKGCKAIVIACNTATVIAIDQLRAQVTIPIIGVEPAIKPASKQSENKKIGILVTQATSENKRFLTLIKTHQNDNDIFIQPCAGLVELIEQGQFTSPVCQQLLQQYIQPLLQKNIDTLVLGCTHYPFLKHQIAALIGDNINIIDGASAVAIQLGNILYQHNLSAASREKATTKIDFYCSKKTPNYQQLFAQLFYAEPQQSINLQHFDQNQIEV
ncbi:MAG: glutamate racemase [Alteromonadaceae bacterium]|nr:glutamate racemase [Alteromonadaceae bacterium]